jgi:hypothetical protein
LVADVAKFRYGRIDEVEPAAGQLGTLVTISGQGLLLDSDSLAQVKFAGIDADAIYVQNNSHIILKVGESATNTGTSPVSVINSVGNSVEKPLAFTYLEPSVIKALVHLVGNKEPSLPSLAKDSMAVALLLPT